jgi:hypothetical protein
MKRCALLFAALSLALLGGVACSDEQKKDLGEEDVKVILEDKTEQAVDDADAELDGDLDCTADLDDEPNVTASCTGTTEAGDDVEGTFDGTADVDDADCTATLLVVIGDEEVANESNVNCFGT